MCPEFGSFLFRIGLGTKGSRLNYEEFLRAFEDGRKEHYQRPLPEVRIEECGALSPQEAETKLRQMIETQGDVLGKVCRVIVVLEKMLRFEMLLKKMLRLLGPVKVC